MRNSIIFKTTASVLATLLLVMFTIGWYVYDSQTSIIAKLQHSQKEFTQKQLLRNEVQAIQEKIKQLHVLVDVLKDSITNFVVNADLDSAKIMLKKLLMLDNIKAISIYDAQAKEIFLSGYKDKKEIIIDTVLLPDKFKSYPHIKEKLFQDGELQGYFTIYYDNSQLIATLKKIKEEDIQAFNKEITNINAQIKTKLKQQALIAIFGVFLVVLLIVFLLNRFVNKPLSQFQQGLDSFFEYLADATKQIKVIDIDTDDEFGQMAKSVNKNIRISQQIHNEIREQNILSQKLNDELTKHKQELELLNRSLEQKVKERTQEIQIIHKHVKDSITFASLLQEAVISKEYELGVIFNDYFAIWRPKDIVGGDIWLFSELRHQDECLLFVIDCTG
ncbi:MAG: hypothetical protein GXO40_05625, partial [Epsilonproteobacteria bacterium]|nr:hypothetical protein [Campylobacterota bacterium]